jgi:hypothetical protein
MLSISWVTWEKVLLEWIVTRVTVNSWVVMLAVMALSLFIDEWSRTGQPVALDRAQRRPRSWPVQSRGERVKARVAADALVGAEVCASTFIGMISRSKRPSSVARAAS